jgi:hypothetical protein
VKLITAANNAHAASSEKMTIALVNLRQAAEKNATSTQDVRAASDALISDRKQASPAKGRGGRNGRKRS